MRLDQVRSDWTVLGSADPLWAVLVSPENRDGGWSREAFLATGRDEIARVLRRLAELGLQPGRERALDLGCGAGRLTSALAAEFDHVVGVDISPTMLETARAMVSDERCEFVENTEPHLHRFQDDSFDLAVSSLVLQHLPPEVTDTMLSELIRVTRPGGAVVVQVAEEPDLSARGLLTRVLPRGALRFAQQHVLGYPAPMDMWATPLATVARIAASAGARIADAPADPMYGGHWRYRRYYLAVRGPDREPLPAGAGDRYGASRDARATAGAAASVTGGTAAAVGTSASDRVDTSVSQGTTVDSPSPETPSPGTPSPETASTAADRATAATAVPAETSPSLTRTALQWLRARPERPVWVTALVLGAVLVTVRAVLAFRGTFYLDDLAFTGRAARLGLSPNFVFLEYNSHLMPGAFVWVWATTGLAPLSYAPVATVDVVLQVLLAVQFYRLLRDLFGLRPAILVPFTLYLFSPVTLPAFLWWAAALNQLPQQLAMVIALRCHVAYLRTGRTRRGVLGAVALVGGLAFSEKTLLTVPLVLALTVLCFQSGPPVRRTWQALVRHRRVWAAYLVVALPYAVYYELAVPSPVRATPSGRDVLHLADTSFRQALVPGLLGGPWRWKAIGWAGALADTAAVVSWICLAAAIAFIALTVRLRRNALLGWSLALGYAVVNLALLTVSRATIVGPLIGQEYRYITDVALVVAIGGALALIPIRSGPWALGEPQRSERRPARADSDLEDLPLATAARELAAPWAGRAGAVLVSVLLAASGLVSTVRYDHFWRINPVRPWLANITHDLGRAHGPMVFDEGVPDSVAWGLLYPYNLESRLLRPLPERPRFLAVGQASDHLAVIDSTGHLRRAAVNGVPARPGPAKACGWLVQDTPVRIRLASRLPSGTWVLRMGYISSAEATSTLTVDSTRVTVPIHRGLGEVFLRLAGRPSSFQLSGLTGGASMCTSDITVGFPVAVPGTTVS